MNLGKLVAEADRRIRPHARETPLLESPALSEAAGARVYLKLENLQVTGSFKARGALNRMLTLDPTDRARGVVTASTGNHGAATAYAGRIAGVRPTVFIPEGAVASKVARIRRLGADIVVHGTDSGETETFARAEAARRGLEFLSPYNDWDVMAGQGTIAAELLRQCPGLDAVVVAVGGGGLIGGIAGYLASARPGVRVIGCSPEHSAVMAASVAAGKILELPSLPTLSDGTAGGVEEGTITFAPCAELVERYELVTEAEIAEAMRSVFREEGLVIEGAAGVAVAALFRLRAELAGASVAVVLCGGNVDPGVWYDIVAGRGGDNGT